MLNGDFIIKILGGLSVAFIILFLIVLLINLIHRMINLVHRTIKERLYLKRMARSGIRDIDKMDGYQFEVYLKSLFKELGYKPHVTQASVDFGADLILKGKNTIVIQAKRYKLKSKVSISAIQEIYAAKAYYKADEAWVITNSLFTKSAKALAEACEVKLLDRGDLQQFINTINPSVTASQVYNEVVPSNRKCPSCAGELTLRMSGTGNKFMGCSNFPNCKHTETLNHK